MTTIKTAAKETNQILTHPQSSHSEESVTTKAQGREKSRVVTRYVGSGIKGVGSGIRRVRSGIAALGSGITDHGIGISKCFWDQGSGCTIFVGSGTKIGHAFGIKEQKFAYKNGISDEKTYLVTTLRKGKLFLSCRGVPSSLPRLSPP